MNRILNIKELDSIKLEGEYYTGWEIETTKETVKLLIDDEQSCCEDYGSIVSEDNFKYFIGKDILNIDYISDKEYSEGDFLKKDMYDTEHIDVLDCAFINIKTNVGDLQFAVYNEHNGYYGHDIKIIIER